jgi:hypothetical protein
MTISITRYVDITSGVGAGNPVPTRTLMLRIFSTNPLIPTGGIVTFSNISEVGEYFGTSSEEYLRAADYFGFTSKNDTRAQFISYSRWVDTAVAPLIYGQNLSATLGQLQAVTTGSFNLTLGGVSHDITGLNFSAAVSFAGVAALLQTAIRAADTDNQWDQSTVTYASGTNGFNFVGGETVADNIAIAAAATGVDIRALIGWLPGLEWPNGPIFSNGSLVETLTTTLTNSDSSSDNFGSFLFIPTLDQAQVVEVTTWNEDLNFKYMFATPVSVSNASAISTALSGIGGTAMTLAPISTEYPEQLPCTILGATDYSKANSVQDYMYQSASNLTASVSTDTDADGYDALFVNYYGLTQTAGQQRSFYQRGVLSGFEEPTNATDIGTYVNEIWLKADATAALFNLLNALPSLSADDQGKSQIISALQPVINQALLNGTISTNSFLDADQKADITNLTNNPRAWRQVQSNGYYLTVTVDGVTGEATYLLIYKKNDVIRKIVGTDVLI